MLAVFMILQRMFLHSGCLRAFVTLQSTVLYNCGTAMVAKHVYDGIW